MSELIGLASATGENKNPTVRGSEYDGVSSMVPVTAVVERIVSASKNSGEMGSR